jgi:predicted dehydrogenase
MPRSISVRTLWRDSWIEVPRPHPVAGSTLLEVEATVPIAPLGPAHGRELASPARKVASFLFTDGLRATARKTRSKRAESSYTGDYHLVLVLGAAAHRSRAEPARFLALAPKAPRCAGLMLVADALLRPVPDAFGEAELAAAAARLTAAAPSLPGLAQSYLYSGMDPPAELTRALDDVLAAEPAPQAGVAKLLRPPPGAADGTETIALRDGAGESSSPPVAVLGAGDYVRIEIARTLASSGLRRAVIADREPQVAALAAAELGFAAATTNADAAIDALDRRGLVLVATAHDSHAHLAAHALRAGHRVFCEKPVVVTPADLDLILAASAAHPGELDVGFNRRHNPIVERARREIARQSGPATLVATIREVDITPDHWYLWPNQGTRVAGNLCHWIDLALHLLGPGARPTSVAVSPRASTEPGGLDAERTFTILFDDGSSVTLLPTGRGDSVRGVQEQVEVRRGALTLHLDDLWKLTGLRNGTPLRRRTLWRDKGHGRMYAESLARFRDGRPAAYPADDLRRVSEVQIAATRLLEAGEAEGTISSLIAAASSPG